jgi:hypothetical protein
MNTEPTDTKMYKMTGKYSSEADSKAAMATMKSASRNSGGLECRTASGTHLWAVSFMEPRPQNRVALLIFGAAHSYQAPNIVIGTSQRSPAPLKQPGFFLWPLASALQGNLVGNYRVFSRAVRHIEGGSSYGR